jgi:GGDEF domain-containing protein
VERRLGTAVSNTLLQAFALRVRQCLRPGDLVARSGNGRLVVLLDHLGPLRSTNEVLARIRSVADDPYAIVGEHFEFRMEAAAGPVWSAANVPTDANEIMDGLWVPVGDARSSRLGDSGEPRRAN